MREQTHKFLRYDHEIFKLHHHTTALNMYNYCRTFFLFLKDLYDKREQSTSHSIIPWVGKKSSREQGENPPASLDIATQVIFHV